MSFIVSSLMRSDSGNGHRMGQPGDDGRVDVLDGGEPASAIRMADNR